MHTHVSKPANHHTTQTDVAPGITNATLPISASHAEEAWSHHRPYARLRYVPHPVNIGGHKCGTEDLTALYAALPFSSPTVFSVRIRWVSILAVLTGCRATCRPSSGMKRSRGQTISPIMPNPVYLGTYVESVLHNPLNELWSYCCLY